MIDHAVFQRLRRLQNIIAVHIAPDLIHGLAGQATDIDIYAREILRMRETLNDILAKATGQPVEKIARDVDRDYILEPLQALEYGMIDHIIESRALQPVTK